MSQNSPLLDILIVTYNAYKEFKASYDSLMRSLDCMGEVRIYILDNCSTDIRVTQLLSKLRLPDVVFNKTNQGFTLGMNQLLKLIHAAPGGPAKYVLFMNPDVVIQTMDWLSIAIDRIESTPDCGILGPLALNAEGTQADCLGANLHPDAILDLNKPRGGEHCFRNTPTHFLPKWPPGYMHPCTYIPFLFAVVRGSLLYSIPYLDERHPHIYSDCVFCMRAQEEVGMLSYASPDIVVRHVGGASSVPVQQESQVPV